MLAHCDFKFFYTTLCRIFLRSFNSLYETDVLHQQETCACAGPIVSGYNLLLSKTTTKTCICLVNVEIREQEMKFEKLCAAGDCSSMPAKQKMQIKVSCQKADKTKKKKFINIFSYIYRFTMTAPSTLIPVMLQPIWTRW